MNENEIRIAKNNLVIIQKMSFSDTSTCHVKRCKKRDIYTIFIGDSPRFSTMAHSCCSDHLKRFIDISIKESQKQVRNTIAAAKREERKKAKTLLGIS